MSAEQRETHERKFIETSRPNPYDLVGVLPDWAIKEFLKDGYIKIDPMPEGWEIWEEVGDPLTVDFHLGNRIKRFKKDGREVIDTRYSTRAEIEDMMLEEILKPGQPTVLGREDFLIVPTIERLTLPDDIMGLMEGKSRYARLAVLPFYAAARFDPGWDGHPVMEIGTDLPADKRALLYPGEPICAFRFEKLAWKVARSYSVSGRYGGSTDALAADFSKTNGNSHLAETTVKMTQL